MRLPTGRALVDAVPGREVARAGSMGVMSKATARTSVALLIGTALTVAFALAVVPMHVTPGNGSLRCGTVIAPDRSSEIRDVCPKARSGQVRATLAASVVLALLSLLPLLAARMERDQVGRGRLVIWVVIWGLAAILALAWIGWFVEYTPPGGVFEL